MFKTVFCFCYLFFLIIVITKCEEEEDYDDDEDWSSLEVIVEETINPELVHNNNDNSDYIISNDIGKNNHINSNNNNNNSLKMENRDCPIKCLCYQSTVRCMLLNWEKSMQIEAVPSSAEIL
jgi:hypothetical protein